MKALPKDPEAMISKQDAAKVLGVTTRTVDRLRSSGRLPAYRLGAQLVRFKLGDVKAVYQPIN